MNTPVPETRMVLLVSQLILAEGDSSKRQELLNAAFPRILQDSVTFDMSTIIVGLLDMFDRFKTPEVMSIAEKCVDRIRFNDLVAHLSDTDDLTDQEVPN